VLRPVGDAFAPEGGLRMLVGNLGQAVIKVSALDPAHLVVRAPARIFEDQADFERAFRSGELDLDVVVVLRFQGPRANGMPELHKLVPALSVLLERGHQVALVTDGRMSGASGTVPAAIQVTPEAANGGVLARLRDGDELVLDAINKRIDVRLDPAVLNDRTPAVAPAAPDSLGRRLFAGFRERVSSAETGASIFDLTIQPPVPIVASGRPDVQLNAEAS
jgi:phosphogluconate dehydratase